jgi:hypothetical protein
MPHEKVNVPYSWYFNIIPVAIYHARIQSVVSFFFWYLERKMCIILG